MPATSAHLAIVAAVAALFKVAPALAGGHVLENSDDALPTGREAQVQVNWGGTEPLDINMGVDAPRDWDTGIEIVIQARRAGSTEARVAADEIWTEAYARVMADQTLGDRVWNLAPGGAEIDVDKADTALAKLTWRFSCSHRTNNQTLSP